MDRYYYHGIEPYAGIFDEQIELMIKILSEGILTRNVVKEMGKDDEFNHVCLYKKNDCHDYENVKEFPDSAANGWINNCFVFVISPDVEAIKADNSKNGVTNLVDEWRTFESIPPSKIVGIAIPYDSISNYLEDKTLDNLPEVVAEKENIIKLLPILEEIVTSNGQFIVNSNIPDFTDQLDSSLADSMSRKR